MKTARLTLELRSDWHAGTGRGSGYALDAKTHRDANGLPVLPGRTVKGLLRDAVQRAAACGWYGETDPTASLFGWRPGLVPDKAPVGSRQGCLRVSDATLPPAVAAWLAQTDDGRRLLPGLFRSHFSTRIEHDTGTAAATSLRGMEVVVPLTLSADICPLPATAGRGEAPGQWLETLQTALPLLRELGSHRSRGLGRVIASLEGIA